MPHKDPFEKEKQKEYLEPLLYEIDVAGFMDKPEGKGTHKMAAAIDIPDIEDKPGAAAPAGPPMGGPMGGPKPPAPPLGGPPPAGAGPAGSAPMGAPKPPMSAPLGAPLAGGPPPPMGGPGGLPPMGAPKPPMGGPSPMGSPIEAPPISGDIKQETKLTDKDKEEILDSIAEIKEHLNNVRSEFQMSIMKDEIIEKIKGHYTNLERELESLKNKKIPERKLFDTEGTYRDNLYGIATRVLDEFLPDLFEDIPEYNFIATHVSRTFEDGTVADAIITLVAVVIRGGMKYEFKVDIPVLNGLMQYPMYIQRGQKIIPLTKAEIQRELDSMSYRKVDVETPYEKENIFNNIGENIHRRPDDQKWYEVAPNTFKPTQLPPDHLLQVQRGKGIR